MTWNNPVVLRSIPNVSDEGAYVDTLITLGLDCLYRILEMDGQRWSTCNNQTWAH